MHLLGLLLGMGRHCLRVNGQSACHLTAHLVRSLTTSSDGK